MTYSSDQNTLDKNVEEDPRFISMEELRPEPTPSKEDDEGINGELIVEMIVEAITGLFT